MNIHEYQAKEILKNYGLPVLKGKSYNKNLETLDADMKDLKGPPWVCLLYTSPSPRDRG